METFLELANYDLPAWSVALITFIGWIFSLWAKLKKLAVFLRNANRRFTYGVRCWLGIPSNEEMPAKQDLVRSEAIDKIINLTQEEYDALDSKDPKTMYLVSDKLTEKR